MGKFKDLIGQRFGRLTVIRLADNKKHGRIAWLCQCDCGQLVEALSDSLMSGNTKSCGCLQKEKARESGRKTIWRAIEKNIKHGDAKQPQSVQLYFIWRGLKCRCYNKNNPAYKYYGGRGILINSEWKTNYLAFKAWSLANGYEEGLSIDRIDSNGDYCPENCQWIGRSENSKKARLEEKARKESRDVKN